MNAQAPAPVKSELDPKVPWLYFIAVVSQMIGNTIAGSYLSFYMTERMLMSAIIMGGVLLATRIADLIIGVLSGVIVQKVCFKHGQFRTWLLYGPIVVGLGTTMCFINPNIPMAAKAVMVFIGYIGYGGGMSFIQVSQNGMMAKVAGPDINARMAISAKIVQGQNTGRLLTSMITLPLITLFEGMGHDGYTIMQLIFVTIGVAGQMVLFVGTKKYEQYDPNFKSGAVGSIKVTTMVSNTLKNGQIIIVMLADTLRSSVTMSLASLAMYYFTYVAGNRAMMTVYMTTSAVVGLLAAFMARPVSKKLGKRNSALVGGILATVFYACVMLFAGQNPYLYIVFIALAAASIMIPTALGANMYLDCAEYQLYKTGQDNRTFAMSMYGVTIKLGFVASSVIISALLEASGYTAATATSAATMANPGLFVKLIGGFSVVCYIGYIVLYLTYRITEDKAKEYASANHAAAAERAAAAQKKD